MSPNHQNKQKLAISTSFLATASIALVPCAAISANLQQELNNSNLSSEKESTIKSDFNANFVAQNLIDEFSGEKQGPPKGGVPYNAHDGSYIIAFPQRPTERKEYIDTAIGKIYLVEAYYADNNRYYSTSHTTYPVPPNQYDPEKGLDGSRDGIAGSVNMSIVSEERITMNGFPARKVVMQGKDGALIAYLIIDPNGPTLYQVFVLASDGKVDSPEIQAFMESFRFQ